MARYAVYLEIDDSACMAHVLEPPGISVGAGSRAEALAKLPDAIRAYWAWLRDHGEPTPGKDEVIEAAVIGESRGRGPFAPGDTAALFPPDREPVTQDEMERYFRLLAHSRADLLALVVNLPDAVLDWQRDGESFSIRRILRHVGNAEEWYVSRLVPPDTLPAEWEHDEALPVLDFLEMERRTAMERLRRLTEEERQAVVRPTRWTDHPDEEWTARKTLRRFLEHEREHTGQVKEVLAARRRELLDRMAVARAALLAEVNAWSGEALTLPAIVGDWTVRDVLAHIAAWDRWSLPEMQRVAAGQPPDLSLAHDEDAFNAVHVAAWRHRSLGDVMIELQAARAAVLAWLEALPAEELLRRQVVGSEDWSFPAWIDIYARHDAEHAAQIAGQQPET